MTTSYSRDCVHCKREIMDMVDPPDECWVHTETDDRQCYVLVNGVPIPLIDSDTGQQFYATPPREES